jgi:hypothetical protein
MVNYKEGIASGVTAKERNELNVLNQHGELISKSQREPKGN